MKVDYVQKNKEEFLRLKNILSAMTQELWLKKMDRNWTVGNSLLHLAFWDKMTYERLSQWKSGGVLAPVPDAGNIDAMNASVRAMSNVMDHKNASEFIIQCAEMIDEMVAKFMPPDLDLLRDSGKERWFMRYVHRSEHLDKVEAVFAS